MLLWTGWEVAVKVLGLEPGGDLLRSSFAGTVEGKRVHVAVANGKAVVRVPIDPVLDLGLLVEPEGMLTGTKVPSGNLEFDGLFTVAADEPARAMELLTPPVLKALVNLLERSMNVRVSDEAIEITGDGDQWLKRAVPLAVGIAHHVDGRRPQLRIATPLLGLRPLLGRFAIDRGLRIDDNPLRVSGTTEDIRVQVLFAREGLDRIAMMMQLALADALGLGLRIEPAGMLTPFVSLLPGQKDHRMGDDAFDAAFHIRTSRPDLLAQLLDGPTRAALATCSAGARSFALDDAGLTAAVPIDDLAPRALEVLRTGLDTVTRIARALRAAPPPEPRGPFR